LTSSEFHLLRCPSSSGLKVKPIRSQICFPPASHWFIAWLAYGDVSFERSADFQRITLRYVLSDRSPRNRRCENLKSNIFAYNVIMLVSLYKKIPVTEIEPKSLRWKSGIPDGPFGALSLQLFVIWCRGHQWPSWPGA
jgi:hypothetical protein